MKYIDVVLPLPIDALFTYAVPDDLIKNAVVGMRVVVPFGRRKMYTAIVFRIHENKPVDYQTKEIICFLDEFPILRPLQLKFWEWISSYYLANLGDVYQIAIPSGFKLQSETQIRLNEDFEPEEILSSKEIKIVNALSSDKVFTVSELIKMTGIQNILPVVKMLIEKNVIEASEKLTERYKPKVETFVRLSNSIDSEEKLQQVFDDLKHARKQLDVLMNFVELSHCLSENFQNEVSKKELLRKSNASSSIFQNLVEKKILSIYQKEIGRLDRTKSTTQKPSELNEFQQKAFDEVENQFAEKSVVLLHGVTSSGKTEIYIHLIEKMIQEGKQVLYLVPEIALTTQLTSRLINIFGNRLCIYHSKFSNAERIEIWNDVLNDRNCDVVIGVRSSIFLPFSRLGLVIVDEEHEISFKQFETPPLYHARNAAIVLAAMYGAKTLLGSATPSIESYHNAQTGKYGYVELNQRFLEMELPEIHVVNLKEMYRKKQMNRHFSTALVDVINDALIHREQVILFQNRRGYAPYLECKSCSYVPRCKNCDVSLTVHKHTNQLICHYCGYTEPIPQVCPECHTPGLSDRGFGTERIEQEIQELFPNARTSRMDLDTTHNKKSYEKIIGAFESGDVDILIGTQMITKGLDFDNVSVVGILNADNLLNFPDFRANERAYQLISQVSGRAGRKNKRGTVILQTSNPDHPIIQLVKENDYDEMYRNECFQRKMFHYPPYFRLIEITLQHRELQKLNDSSAFLAVELSKIFGKRVLGPIEPLIPRIQNFYIKNILLKIEITSSSEKAKHLLKQTVTNLLASYQFKSLKITVDVDPL